FSVDPASGRVHYARGGSVAVERESVSTTQPSIDGPAGQGASLGESPGEGILGGASLAAMQKKSHDNWPLGLIFGVLGGALIYPFHRYVLGGVVVGMGCLVILNPALFQVLLIVAGIIVVIANYR